jgi:glycosyltransferase involved in cell wall biosynthesis
MAVRNGAHHVAAAVQSVLAQTHGDLEFLVIDDGSTDGTADVLCSIRDARLRVQRQEGQGLTRSLNRALALTSAPLVARLDADDVSLPHRLASQVAFLDAHRGG